MRMRYTILGEQPRPVSPRTLARANHARHLQADAMMECFDPMVSLRNRVVLLSSTSTLGHIELRSLVIDINRINICGFCRMVISS
mmetsp:Transcript_33983/g.85305  ORF Transcript_33983/g.85305 Transcript_33983/m.85305 type:complete len:85 (-) Transcript_33983:348-602(-)